MINHLPVEQVDLLRSCQPRQLVEAAAAAPAVAGPVDLGGRARGGPVEAALRQEAGVGDGRVGSVETTGGGGRGRGALSGRVGRRRRRR